MVFVRAQAPRLHRQVSVSSTMAWVLLACLPGALALIIFFGWGYVINLLLSASFCLAVEALCLKGRGQVIKAGLLDGSALVTAVLIALALPPYAPWWLLFIGAILAIALAKQAYGGIGRNLFNPAMAAYALLCLSFPVEMTQWTLPKDLLAPGQTLPSLTQTLGFLTNEWNHAAVDGFSGATALEIVKHNNGQTLLDLYQHNSQLSRAYWASSGWEWSNAGFLLGGLILLSKRIFTWHAPLSMLVTLTLFSAFGYDNGSSNSGGSPLLHLFSGGTMLAAFFILTDPVTSPASRRGRLIYGAATGGLIMVLRHYGQQTDGIAFSILLMNAAVPLINRYTIPKAYGQQPNTSETQG